MIFADSCRRLAAFVFSICENLRNLWMSRFHCSINIVNCRRSMDQLSTFGVFCRNSGNLLRRELSIFGQVHLTPPAPPLRRGGADVRACGVQNDEERPSTLLHSRGGVRKWRKPKSKQ